MDFPVVMYRCESCTIKKAEHQRIDAFELCCWRRLLRVPWTAKRSNQSILKEVNPEYLLEELKLQYFGHLMWRADSFEKTLMLGNTEDKRRRWQRMRRQHLWLNRHESAHMLGDSGGQRTVLCYSPLVHRSWPQLSNSTTTETLYINYTSIPK